jgi:hypothetical protein
MGKILNRNLLILSLLAISVSVLTGCGKRGVPIPPRERITQNVEIAGYQQGGEILITWKMPARNAAPRSVQNIARADIYRLIEPAASFTVLTEEEFADRSTIVSSVEFTANDFGAKTFTVADPIDFTAERQLVRYAVRLVNGLGQKAGFSNFLSIEPEGDIALQPSELNVTASQPAVILRWDAPELNLNGSEAGNLVGYNVYRKVGSGEFKKLNAEVIDSTGYEDESFEFGKSYKYFLRAVSFTSSGKQVESADSETVEIAPVDTFPPDAPEAVTIAASPNEISIFFASNLENDIAGYMIFRSEDRELPLEDWKRLNSELLTTNTFRDESVEGGKTYYYFVIAVDERGNRSTASEIVGDTVPTR